MKNLFSLEDNADFSISLYQKLEEKSNYNLNLLNTTERKIFLCMLLENFSQADGILAFLQENYPQYTNEVIEALQEIGATKSAEIITQAVALLPEDRTWFFDSSNEHSEKLMKKLDAEFTDYPDGFMRDLYRKYAEIHKKDLIF